MTAAYAPSPDRISPCCARPSIWSARTHAHDRALRCRPRRARAFFAVLFAVASAPAARARSAYAARAHREPLARMVRPERTERPLGAGDPPLAHTLKALAYEPTGGIVAAPTTSLPEQLGGTRNWDYRYCWLRDATITLLAMMRGGYYDEARAWRAWLGRVMAGSPSQIQIMYGIAGERRLPEWEIPWLPGYEGASPVRIGNGAVEQLQLDVYGEVMNALHLSRASAACRAMKPPDRSSAPCCSTSTRSGISPTKVSGKCAADASTYLFEGDGVGRLRPRDQIGEKIRAARPGRPLARDASTHPRRSPEKGWNPKRAGIRSSTPLRRCTAGTHSTRASCSSLCSVFWPPKDPRVTGTVHAIETDLTHDGLVKRYHTAETADGLPPGEGTFLACSFWLVDNLALQDRIDEAHQMFERLVGLANDVGLLSDRSTTRWRSAWWGTSRRRSPTWRWSIRG